MIPGVYLESGGKVLTLEMPGDTFLAPFGARALRAAGGRARALPRTPPRFSCELLCSDLLLFFFFLNMGIVLNILL